MKPKITVVGAGNWGTAVARLIAKNLTNKKELKNYDETVNLWIFDEVVEGKNLSDIINQERINIKYLPSVVLPENVLAVPDMEEAVKNANVVVIVVPHEFYRRIVNEMSYFLKEDVIAVSLTKGIEFNKETKSFKRMTQVLMEETGLDEDKVGALSGPNIANDVANDVPLPTVIASTSKQTQKILFDVFDNENFKVELVDDVTAIELGGALKNVVAIGAGIAEGLGLDKEKFMEKGLEEMQKFASYHELGHKADPDILEGLAGRGDLYISCEKGRNRKVGVEIGKRLSKGLNISLVEIEKELLQGQKSQGIGTTKEVYEVLDSHNLVNKFPIFKIVYEILFKNRNPMEIKEII